MAAIEPTSHSLDHEMAETTEEEIKHVRSQIQELTNRRRLISNTLLSSTNVQYQLKTFTSQEDPSTDVPPDLPTDVNPLSTTTSTSTSITHLTNMHRLSFTVTTFPFTDPSPLNSHLNGRLLGIRIDHCSRLGVFGKPFYILLRRVEQGGDQWRIHRHTLPAFIPLKKLEDEYLPLSEDSGYGGSDGGDISGDSAGSTAREQNLPALVRKVRHELICWTMRREAIDLLREQVNLVPTPRQASNGKNKDDEDADDNDDDISMFDDNLEPLYGILSIEPTTFEARQARITWTDGTVARIKISDRGVIERAVVVGVNGRIRGVENLLVDGESRIEGLVEKLKVLVGEGQ